MIEELRRRFLEKKGSRPYADIKPEVGIHINGLINFTKGRLISKRYLYYITKWVYGLDGDYKKEYEFEIDTEANYVKKDRVITCPKCGCKLKYYEESGVELCISCWDFESCTLYIEKEE